MKIRPPHLRVTASILGCLVLTSCAAPKPAAPAGETAHRAEKPAGFFPIMSWETPPRTSAFADREQGLASLAGCGYTVAAFVSPEDLPECRRVGLRAMLRLDPVKQSWKGLSDEQIADRVRRLVGETGRDPVVLGYFLKDEPG